MSVIGTVKMTARQFAMLGEDPPGVRLELVDGEIAVSPSPRPPHSHPDRRLTQILLNHIDEYELGTLLGDVDTVFGEFDVRRPDLIFYRKDREHFAFTKGMLQSPPDLCVEILSPSSGVIDRKDKFRQYAEGGVPYYWILDPEQQTIEGYQLSGGKYELMGSGAGDDLVTLPPFPNLKIPLGKLWVPGTK